MSRDLEHRHQVALMTWAENVRRQYPELAWLHAVPNGGHRSKAAAGRLKAEGVRAGVPDLFLDVARGDWHGLRIELKAEGGRVTREQRVWIDAYRERGYRAEVCVGWLAARDLIVEYLGGPCSTTCA